MLATVSKKKISIISNKGDLLKYQKKPINIEGWEMYQVDTDGNVYGKNGKILKYSINHGGYCIVNLYHNHVRKGFSVHTLVAVTFIENHDKTKTQVNHKDGIKSNNCVNNLEWTTPKENVEHAINVLGFDKIGKNNPRAKSIQCFSKKTGELKYSFLSLADAARFFAEQENNHRYVQNSIYRALKNERKSYKGYVWRYKK